MWNGKHPQNYLTRNVHEVDQLFRFTAIFRYVILFFWKGKLWQRTKGRGEGESWLMNQNKQNSQWYLESHINIM